MMLYVYFCAFMSVSVCGDGCALSGNLALYCRDIGGVVAERKVVLRARLIPIRS